MKGVVVEKQGAQFEIKDDIAKPSPGATELLVKSLAVAINPVEIHQQMVGILVSSWPQVLGCDASGEVVEVGEEAAKNGWKVGDRVCGCTRLGETGYCTFQDYYLMDWRYTIKVPSNVDKLQAATVGVGAETAFLGIKLLGISYDEIKNGGDEKNEWVLVLGGAGSVGSYGVQLSRIAGYKVMASCSPGNNELVKSLGASATLDYRLPEAEQLSLISEVTGGNFKLIFDAGAKSHELGIKALETISKAQDSQKVFSTTNDWDQFPSTIVNIQRPSLGSVGKPDSPINPDVQAMVPIIEKLLENGKLKPNKVYQGGLKGYEGIIEGLKLVNSPQTSGAKVVVEIA